jgi:hypothetical protein
LITALTLSLSDITGRGRRRWSLAERLERPVDLAGLPVDA